MTTPWVGALLLLCAGCSLVVPASRRTADFDGGGPGVDAPERDAPPGDTPVPLDGAPDVPADVPADVPRDVPTRDTPCVSVDTVCDGFDEDCDGVADPDEDSVNAECPWRRCVDDAGSSRCDVPGEIEAGWYHTCVTLERSGDLWCWGRNDDGELGPGAPAGTNDTPVDTPVTGVVDFCTTANATCFLAGGQVRCFGNVASGFPVGFAEVASDAVEIACGDDELCVRSSDGTVRCAGSNTAGQCGTDPSTSMLLTTLTPVPSLTGATQISVGANFACAVVGGTVQCWGADQGILGRGTTMPRDPVPAPVMASGVSFVEVEAMNFAACARAESGVVSCWGYTPERQVIGRVPPPDFVTAPAASTSSYASLHGGAALHACGLSPDGTIECWGTGLSLALGRPNVTSSVPGVAMPGMPIAASDVAVASAASIAHTCAVERGTGRVLCWGANDFGQCGAPVSGTPLSTAVEVLP